MKFEYEIVATQMTEKGMYFGVKTKDYPELVFSFEEVHVATDENGNEFVDYSTSILGKHDIKEDSKLSEYCQELFLHLLTENTDLNSEDLLPSHQL